MAKSLKGGSVDARVAEVFDVAEPVEEATAAVAEPVAPQPEPSAAARWLAQAREVQAVWARGEAVAPDAVRALVLGAIPLVDAQETR